MERFHASHIASLRRSAQQSLPGLLRKSATLAAAVGISASLMLSSACGGAPQARTPVDTVQPSASSAVMSQYDEQIGLALGENTTSLSYDITAVAQTGPSGIGPSYLLSAPSNVGYWYQIGLSYNYPLNKGGHSTGFAGVAEIFAPDGTSIYGPVHATFSKKEIKAGDRITLNISLASSNITMSLKDQRLGSTMTFSVDSKGATRFVGASDPAVAKLGGGVFEGVMTEEYHVHPYFGREQKVTYSPSPKGTVLTPAFMFVDEIYGETGKILFAHKVNIPLASGQSYTLRSNDPNKNGAVLQVFSDGTLVTGSDK